MAVGWLATGVGIGAGAGPGSPSAFQSLGNPAPFVPHKIQKETVLSVTECNARAHNKNGDIESTHYCRVCRLHAQINFEVNHGTRIAAPA